MGKWLNGARVRKREIDGKDIRIAALAAVGAAQIRATSSGDGTVTLKAATAPSVDLLILIRRLS